MPLYEYICPNCKKRFEKLVLSPKPTDETQECPNCKQDAKKTFSVPAKFAWGDRNKT
jgi:putative FmdB family regulatory protein